MEDKYHWVRSLPGGLIHNVLDHLLIKITEIIPDQHLQLYVDAWEASSALGLPDELRLLLHGRDISASVTFSSTSRPLMHRFTVFGTKNTAHLDLNSGVLTLEPNPTLPGAFGRISSTFSQAAQYFARGTGNLYRFARSKYHPLPGLAALLSILMGIRLTHRGATRGIQFSPTPQYVAVG